MGILLLLLVGLWVAAVCLLGVSGIATLVRAICPAGWLADGHPSPADSDVLIRWDDGSVTTHGQARELAEWMRKTRKQRPAAAQSAKPTKQSNNAAWWEKHERKRRLRAAIAEHNRKPKQPRYLP
ncbi:hypothetical protein [Thermomonas sp.]|uniref:hypothetical protein n=1 Tax=Thermomonas sp. TaxID=1971895 RepID=UPI002597B446|nr:hypothetical protein [Thermomonas sp.]HQE08430.1 hypothetical protein [Thermomonas sp.]